MLFDKTFVFFLIAVCVEIKDLTRLSALILKATFFEFFFVCAISRTRFLCSVQELCYDLYVLTRSTVTFESLKGRRMRL